MSQNISPASRTHAEALAALNANDEAATMLHTQRTQLLGDEAEARDALARGKSSPAILEAIAANAAKAVALLPVIESLAANRPALVRAVDRAAGEQWAERVRALAPEGTYAAMQGIRDELAEQIRAAVDEARAKAEALSTEAGRLADEAARLHRAGVLPRGASYSSSSGLTFDGSLFTAARTDSLAEKVGAQLDQEHRAQRTAKALVRDAEKRQARQVEVAERAAVDAEIDAARGAALTAQAFR